MRIVLARTQGFCAGVARAVKIVEQALDKYGAPLYVYHEIVHNTHVINAFRERGVVFVDDIEQVPLDRYVIFSAHGVAPYVVEQARERRLRCIDATCPLVKRIHKQAIEFSNRNIPVILIGNQHHQEIIGTSGYIRPDLLYFVQDADDAKRLPFDREALAGYLTQTTLSVDDTRNLIGILKDRFPRLIEPQRSNICYATQQRQDAIRELAGMVDIIVVCGSQTSSNSKRLRETGEKCGVPSYLIDCAQDLDLALIKNKESLGISSGASVPYAVVEELILRIKGNFPAAQLFNLEDSGQTLVFPMPEI